MAKQVVIIDDDKNTVVYLSTLLSEHGYNPIPAYDGRAGLREIGESKPDLIILDVMMPEKSGFVLFNLAVWSLVAQVWRTLTRCANAGGSNRGLARG